MFPDNTNHTTISAPLLPVVSLFLSSLIDLELLFIVVFTKFAFKNFYIIYFSECLKWEVSLLTHLSMSWPDLNSLSLMHIQICFSIEST